MMNQKHSLTDHPIIRCPKNTQTTDRETPPAEAWFQQNCCYASLLKLHFGMGAPFTCRFAAYAQNTPKMKHLWGIASDAFTTHSLLMLETSPYVTQSSSSFQKHFSLLTLTNSLEGEYLSPERS